MRKDSVKQPPNPVIKLNRRRDRRQKGEKEARKVNFIIGCKGQQVTSESRHTHIHRCTGDQWIHKTDFNSQLLCTGCVALDTHI